MAKIGKIKLYGEIGRWQHSANSISTMLEQLATSHDEIEIRMHCYGGEVFEGYAIFNAIKNCEKKVTIIIDGIAASMATIIMLAADEIQIARNGFLMIHAPSGSSYGDAQKHINTAKLLRKLEATVLSEYSKRSGQKSKDFRKYLDGNDYWFTASEAKALGLVDVIIDPIEELETIDKTTAESLGSKNLFSKYVALSQPDLFNNNLKIKKMKTIALKLGLQENANETEILKKIDQLITTAQSSDVIKKELETLRLSNITSVVDEAVKQKRITADKKDQFIEVGKKAGVEILKATLETIQPAQKVTSVISKNGNNNNSEYTKLSEVPASELVEMRENDKEKYVKLFKAEYGYAPEM